VSKRAQQARKPVESQERNDGIIAALGPRTKAQIDALEKLLLLTTPPKVMIENSFAGLRNAIAGDLQSAFEDQWTRGVMHGQWLQQQRIDELEQKLFAVPPEDAELANVMAILNQEESVDMNSFLGDLPEEQLISLEELERVVHDVLSD